MSSLIWGRLKFLQLQQGSHTRVNVFIRNVAVLYIGAVSTSNSPRLYRTSGKEYTKEHLGWLIRNGFTTKRAKYICSDCIKHAEKKTATDCTPQTADQSEDNLESVEGDPPVYISEAEEVVSKLESLFRDKKLSSTHLNRICTCLGNELKAQISSDMNSLSGKYKSLENMTNIDCHSFVSNRPSNLVNLLLSISNINPSTDNKKLYNLVLTY